MEYLFGDPSKLNEVVLPTIAVRKYYIYARNLLEHNRNSTNSTFSEVNQISREKFENVEESIHYYSFSESNDIQYFF